MTGNPGDSLIIMTNVQIITDNHIKSSLIQTLLSVLEFHQIMLSLADYTAGREFHPAPKNLI